MTVLLSPRLAWIHDAIPQGWGMADIGTDHAYIPVSLVRQGAVPMAVAGDIHSGPLATARQHVALYGVADRVHVREGNGLEVIAPGEVQTIVIAGMGGGTIRHILDEGMAQGKLAGVECLILQPLEGATGLRTWLADHGWFFNQEDLIAEGPRIYEVMQMHRGNGQAQLQHPDWPAYVQSLSAELGPLLLERRHPLLVTLIERLLERDRRALAGMGRSKQPDTAAIGHKAERIKNLEMVKEWLLLAHKSSNGSNS
ncbi:tRNA (adenine(22)-N(1))-methyltransferase [Heliophilum fasciatum]|uniref:tRNA (Adenine22-N1)-methyltransferase n=1 Tax=Heliophilum fasciatum TaxID=35700 RepID=A0A4R2RKA3_9FIRM|nr:class I SAM-dependent methyltransferase [Heliophilum fasciatum]MCW2278662.1 tRNA (adenine22-N1)-methyltransferase [Heliophilum fasciatum]TCP62617.1 tRNA (adenine22-N1)-methyltransferase [Heliophilum fasciatum]